MLVGWRQPWERRAFAHTGTARQVAASYEGLGIVEVWIRGRPHLVLERAPGSMTTSQLPVVDMTDPRREKRVKSTSQVGVEHSGRFTGAPADTVDYFAGDDFTSRGSSWSVFLRRVRGR